MSTGSKTTQVTKTDPQQLAMLQGNYDAAKPVAAGLSTPYTGALVAPTSQGQQTAQQAYTDIYKNNVGADPLNGAISTAQGFMNFKPNQVGVNYTPSQVGGNSVNAGQLSNTDLTPYLNPFTSDVINTSLAQNERSRQMAQVNDNQRATAANAFGGSRQGVGDSLTNQAYDLNAGQLIAGLNSGNFAQAQAAATGDINRRLTGDTTNATLAQAAQEANQGAGLSAAQLAQAGQVANQTAGLNAAQLGLGAAKDLAGYSDQQLNQAGQRAGFMSSVGDAQQAQKQAELTAQYQEFLRQLTGSQQGQQLLNQALGLFPNQGTTTQTGQSPILPGLVGALGAIGGGLLSSPAAGTRIFG